MKYYELLVDESRDCGKDEEIYVCVRYVCEGLLNEDFFANYIMNKLKEVFMDVAPFSS